MSNNLVHLMQHATEGEDYAVLKRLQLADWLVAIFSKVPVTRRSDGTVDLIATFSSDWEISHSRYNETYNYSPADVGFMIKFMSTHNWSYISSQKQTGTPINSGVPLFLYAQRLYNNIPYSAWREELKNTNRVSLLGKQFEHMEITEYPSYSMEQILEYRVKMYTSVLGELYAYSMYKSNRVGDSIFDTLPATYRRMICQTWIYNAAYRNSNMILDWNDWDNVPEAIDKVESYKQGYTGFLPAKVTAYNLPF